MKVYLITEDIEYEGPNLLSVHSTREKAEEIRQKLLERSEGVFDYTIHELEVDKPPYMGP